jgi:hypothetical protein
MSFIPPRTAPLATPPQNDPQWHERDRFGLAIVPPTLLAESAEERRARVATVERLATRTPVHQIGEMRLCVPACLDELNEALFARLNWASDNHPRKRFDIRFVAVEGGWDNEDTGGPTITGAQVLDLRSITQSGGRHH